MSVNLKKKMDINRTLRLSEDQYYKIEHPKKQIVLHHTVGGSAKSTFNWWLQDPLKIGVAYIIDRDGTIYEVFDPKYWALHLGLKTANNLVANEQAIGIEIASEGGLVKKADGKLYAFDGRQIVKDVYVDLGYEWRGYQYFDAYEDKQIDSVIFLLDKLSKDFSIPNKCTTHDQNRFDTDLLKFNGVITHCNVRMDKTDVHPKFPWNKVFNV